MKKVEGDRRPGVVIIGCGGMARHHIRGILAKDQARIEALVDPLQSAVDEMHREYRGMSIPLPETFLNLDDFFASNTRDIDVALVASPHRHHHRQAVECLRNGLDVLLEKPMVTTAAEAASLIRVRDETDRLLVVAFPGSLSPAIRQASRMVKGGEIGELIGISATVWQDWATSTTGTWRQQFDVSGGGFLFDTGAHMLNTVVDIAGEEFVEVAAMTRTSVPGVEYSGVVIGKLESGAIVTMHGCGETIESCESEIKIFGTRKILSTGVWGKNLHVQSDGEPEASTIRERTPTDVWEQFTLVRQGSIDNPCPPEVGLRMARLWDAIRESSASGGHTVTVPRPDNPKTL